MSGVADVAIVGCPRDVEPLAAAAAMLLAREAGRGPGLVLAWGGGVPAIRAPATRRARALAERLAARDIPASAHGALVRVPLTGDEVIGLAKRAAAAADVPAALAVLAPRRPAVEPILHGARRVLIAGLGEGALAALVLEELEQAGCRPERLDAAVGTAAVLARHGIAVHPALRSKLAGSLR